MFFRKRKRHRRREKRRSVDKTPLLDVEKGNERLTEDEQVLSGSVGFTTNIFKRHIRVLLVIAFYANATTICDINDTSTLALTRSLCLG